MRVWLDGVDRTTRNLPPWHASFRATPRLEEDRQALRSNSANVKPDVLLEQSWRLRTSKQSSS